MNQKIIFFDIDGTLYEPEIGVPDSARRAIYSLLEKNHIPIICTGRTRAMIPEYLMEIGFLGVVAGAGTYVEYKGEVLHNKVAGEEEANMILSFLQKHGIKHVAEGPEHVYFDTTDRSEEYDFINQLLHVIGKEKGKSIDDDNIRFNKISCFLNKPNELTTILSFIKNKYHEINHQDGVLELIPIGYTKATGVQKLLEHLHIDRKDTYAFGDSMNDIEMLDYVEYGIAMGNSYKEVLKRAKYITKSVKEDGIYYGLKEFDLI